MGITIGDALVSVSVIFSLIASAWAIMVGVPLAFPRAAASAQAAYEGSKQRLLIGALLGGGWFFLSVVVLSRPNPVAKLLAWLMLGYAVWLASLGASGVASSLACAIRQHDPGMLSYAARSRAALVLCFATMLPVIGWFVFGPILLLVSLGAGIASSSYRRQAARTALQGE